MRDSNHRDCSSTPHPQHQHDRRTIRTSASPVARRERDTPPSYSRRPSPSARTFVPSSHGHPHERREYLLRASKADDHSADPPSEAAAPEDELEIADAEEEDLVPDGVAARAGAEAQRILPTYAATPEAEQPEQWNTSPDSMVHIPEATLVVEEEEEEREVFMGTPLEPPEAPLPWWKQKRARLPLASFCVVVVALSIALGASLSSEGNEVIIRQTLSPMAPASSPPLVASFFPSTASSSPPSSSLSPSSPPSMAHLEGLFENDCVYLCYPQVLIDGDTAVVTRDFVDIQFFSTTNSTLEIITKIDIDYYPAAVAIHDNTVLIGSTLEYDDVYVYEKDQTGIWSQAMQIQKSNLDHKTFFGYSVAIDGNVMIVGAPGPDGGSAYVYRRNETTWVEEAKLTPGDDATVSDFGLSVSVKGTRIAVGAPGTGIRGEEYKGTVFVYELDSVSKSWNVASGTLVNDDCGEYYGYFVRLMDTQNLLVTCGGDYNIGDAGTVYYYEHPGTGGDYVLEQSIRFQNVVLSLAVSQNAMVLGEFRYPRPLAVHFFVRKNNVWEEVAIIDESTFPLCFGYVLALFGNTTLIASGRNVYQVDATALN